ncbi:hypothetical protein E2562_008609 [Oryza meyeriana var. granulata]|uniref:Uncharacterized protein n=1 Tax=Oryza meyeriana var. granulata TaxID=110450 RepID=A0A6G1C4Z3_9ORYZ|nr:hypothetical protein E2562_008609 [Oryza meyeriana var. granulata]
MGASTSNTRSGEHAAQPLLEPGLLEAAASGDSRSLKELAAQDPSILLGTTAQGNTCLHISSIHGHEGFCKDVLSLNESLLNATNSHGETPMLTSVTSGHAALASVLLRRCRDLGLREAILKQDYNGCNALHHAIRSGHRDLALELIAAEPALSQGVNKYDESPMFIAAMRDFTDVFKKLLEIPESAHVGNHGNNALHAAVRNGNAVIAKEIMEKRPRLAREEENKVKATPLHLAAIWGKTDVVRVLLQHDRSLGYVIASDTSGTPLLVSAAYRGYTAVAREIIAHCPDAPYHANGWTCLHAAVVEGHAEFVGFILESPHLRKVINMRDSHGRTALHHAVQRDIDVTVEDINSSPAAFMLGAYVSYAKTLNWHIN